MKKKLIIFAVTITIIAVYIVNTIITFYHNLKKGENYPIKETKSLFVLTKMDSAIINRAIIHDINVNEIYNSKYRDQVSGLVYKKKYNLLIYRIPIMTNVIDKNINDVVVLEKRSVKPSLGIKYRIVGTDYFNFRLKGGELNLANKIYLTIGADSIQTVLNNDSILCYHFTAHDFALRYSKDDMFDMVYQATENFESLDYEPIMADILFYKKNKDLYFLCLMPIDNMATIDSLSLYNILSK